MEKEEKDLISEETAENTAECENKGSEDTAAENEMQDEQDAVSEYNDTAAQISEMESALAEASDNYRRLFAEYDNYRKRTAKEKTETFSHATMKCVESILPVLDSFERAVESECSDENYKNGMMMIFEQFKDILEKLDVKEVDGLGSEFDPKIHNAISQADSEEYASNRVCQVYQKGYKLGDKLIRPAMVVVAN